MVSKKKKKKHFLQKRAIKISLPLPFLFRSRLKVLQQNKLLKIYHEGEEFESLAQLAYATYIFHKTWTYICYYMTGDA